MNPLSLFTYPRRHKHKTLLLVSLVTLVTLGVYLMVGTVYPILEHNSAVLLGSLTYYSRVYPTGALSLEPTIVSQIRTHPDVVQVIPENGLGLYVNVPSLGISSSFQVLGLSETDVQVLMDVCGLRLKEGRLLRPRTNEILLSEEAANALGLRLGDQIGRSINEQYYSAIPTPLVLVGVLESDPSATLGTDPSVDKGQRTPVAIVSHEYLDNHELFAPRQTGLLVVARENRKAAVDDFLETSVRSRRTYVETHKLRSGLMERNRRTINLVLAVVDCLVAVVVALVAGMINQIALTQRLADLGVLHAIGYHKNQLIRRLTLETAVVAGVGWLAGLVLSWLAIAWLKANFYEPKGMEMDLANLTPLWFSVPIPLVMVSFATVSVLRVFARLDTVSIIERGKLSMETSDHRREMKRSSLRPLSSLTFFQRHSRRGLMLVGSMALMILGVSFPAFFFSPMIDVQRSLYLNHLRHISLVSSGVGHVVSSDVTGQIRSHPAIARIIPTTMLHLAISVPPISENVANIFGVSETDLPYLVELLGLRLKEGRLPRPQSNEIVLSEGLALNRGLRVGDAVGRPIHERDDDIPTEMVIVGILRLRSGQALSTGDISLGFASLQYLESHELYNSRPLHLLVAPAEGSKPEIDRWLQEEIASTRTLVETFDARDREMQQATRNLFLLFAAVESVVAVVAAFALVVLNYIFFAQRREEFGILHAVGRSRLWLLLRTTRETMSMVIVAWLVGAVVCVLGLIYAQAKVYAPVGMSLNVFSLTPWLFTLPIPLTVVTTVAATIAWMLERIDPVSIIERR